MAPTLRWISVAFAAACLLPAAPLIADQVYRWVDDEGKVHYTATLPPEYSDRPYQVINKAGGVVERVDPLAPGPPEETEDAKPEPLYTEDEIRLQSDRLLVLKYHSEDDILEAMEIEIANLGYDARILDQTHASVLKSLAAQIREAAHRERAGMPVNAELAHQVEVLQNRLRRGAQSRVALQARETQIRAMFMTELERYRYLQDGGQPGGPG
jgi:hypothetical protein